MSLTSSPNFKHLSHEKIGMAAIAVTTIAIFVLGWALSEVMRPIYAGVKGYDYDPTYAYLFNALNILKLTTPGHTDHPGTPLQILSAVVVAGKWSVGWLVGESSGGVVDSVLASPESYVKAISSVLLLLNVMAFALLARRILQVTGSITLSLMVQVIPFTVKMVWPQLSFLSPESMALCITATMLGVLVPDVFSGARTNGPRRTRAAIGAGALCGIGIATKVTFLPLLALLLLFRSPRLIAFSVVAMLVALLLSVSPIYHALATTMNWFFQNLTHRPIRQWRRRDC
jgi:hypothetical protein